jgi:hypothetical protein
MPLRMVEVWTRKSAYEFAEVDIPLSVPAPGRVDVAFALPSGWAEVMRFTDGSLEDLIIELARREASIPEPGVEVGPDQSVWQVELAWPAEKVAVVIDADPQRDAWLCAHSWNVMKIDKATSVNSAADALCEQVGGRP